MDELIEALKNAESELDKARTMIGSMPYKQLPQRYQRYFDLIGGMVSSLHVYSNKVLKAAIANNDVIEAER